VSNQPGGILGPVATSWHSDFMFFPRPYEMLSLYGIDIPSAGSQTSFANGVLAASTLPGELRARLDGLYARALGEPANGDTPDRVRFRDGRGGSTGAHQLRPVLWPHHATGEPILAVWEQQTDAIIPLEPAESDELIETLFDHLYQPAHLYEHEWQQDDLIVWDNHALQHRRPYVGLEEPRTLRRIGVGVTQGALWQHFAARPTG
jgi:alpha-ketoglutarate-dependent taurine dioxygenase